MTTSVARESSVGFDVDAMLMYGWVADSNRHLTHVNNSLRRFIRDRRPHAPQANQLLDAMEGNDAPVTVRDFLQSLVDPRTEETTGALVDRYMARLEELVEERLMFDRQPEEHDEPPYKVRVQYHAPRGDEALLAGARFVRDSATLLAARWNSERVDVVVVVRVERHAGWWRIVGFQGQLQEAWLRVKARIEDGNRAASIALMARNLSHNVGSHALYWVASQLREKDTEQERFLSYMQVRMELLAGFATSMPLAPIPSRLEDVVNRFQETSLLLANICRSEGISRVSVEVSGYKDEAVFFGGELGVQAFYSILENCIRDSAKFSPLRKAGDDLLKLHVVAKEFGRFVRIDVFDEGKNFAQHGPELQKNVEFLRLAYDSGQLDERNWGIKERFVCAAILRGIRPETIPLAGARTPDDAWLGAFVRNEQRILEMVEIDDNCAWRFYLPRRHSDLLLVTNRELAVVPASAAVQTVRQFHAAVKSPTGITAPFVVLDADAVPEAGVAARALEARLPYRTYVRGDSAPGRFMALAEPLEAISPTLLLQRSVRELAKQQPRLIIGMNDDEWKTLAFSDPASADPVLIVRDRSVEELLSSLHQQDPAARFAVFRRHSSFGPYGHLAAGAKNAQELGIDHFEAFDCKPYLQAGVYDLRNDLVRAANRLIEAALTKILILDERLDLALETKDRKVRGRLGLRGITVRGSEFAGHATLHDPASVETLRGWSNGAHFVLLHRGIAEKLVQDRRSGKVIFEDVVTALEAYGARVIIHSGRMGMADMPQRTKFISLANVAAWIDREYSKLRIVDELFSLRRI